MDDFKNFDELYVEFVPELAANVVFTTPSAQVFREDGDITPATAFDDVRYMPWGANNTMPYDIMRLIDEDETVSTCMGFNNEVAFAAGVEYRRRDIEDRDMPPGLTSRKKRQEILDQVDEFTTCNNLGTIYLGQCADMKMFDMCVTLICLSEDNSRITRIVRRHAAYCRFAVQDEQGRIDYILYANWRNRVGKDNCDVIPLLDSDDLLCDLRRRIRENPRRKYYAVVSKVPKASSTYYPVPAYASLFKSDWYDIKQLIGKAKKAKLKNSAPIKYHIEVQNGYWVRALEKAGITDPVEAKEYVTKLRKEMIDFLTGAENAGKVLFSSIYTTPDGREIPEVKITKISSDEKEGGDYTTDIQEAVNMVCFAMRVHSNLVGSVPGKSQSNNSGSDKRELYTIAQTLQKPYHEIMLEVHRLVCRFNGWYPLVEPKVSIIQLTTLDQHSDAKTVTQ